MYREKFIIENQGIYTYLTYQLEPNDNIDTMGLGMITNNQIDGISQVIYSQMDNEIFLKYNISAKVSVSDFFSGAVSRKRLLGVFSSIMEAVISAEEYMIDYSNLLFDLDYIFVDVSTNKAEMICIPLMKEDAEPVDLGLFFKNIMFSTQFDQTENSDYVAKIMNYLNSSPTLNPMDFKIMIDKLQNVQGGMQNVSYGQASSRQPVQAGNTVNSQTRQTIASPPLEKPAIPPTGQSNNPQQLTPDMQPPIQNNVNLSGNNSNIKETVGAAYTNTKKEKKNKKKNTVKQSSNMQIPNQNVANQQMAQNAEVSQKNEKPMSWLYLMQHYNKENAAIYKAQKANKKSSATKNIGNAPKVAIPGAAQATQNNSARIQKPAPSSNAGFAIPGQTPPEQNTINPKSNSVAPGMAMNRIEIPGTQPVSAGTMPPVGNTRTSNTQLEMSPAADSGLAENSAPLPSFTPNTLGQTNANFGETVVLNQGMTGTGETTVLGGGVRQMEIVPFLIRSKNNEKIVLSKPVFRIGKEKSYVDYFVSDNTAVSRSHANIITKDKEYFIVDTNSKNHTYVNGSMIPSNTEVKIAHGAKIRLANEDFVFNLY